MVSPRPVIFEFGRPRTAAPQFCAVAQRVTCRPSMILCERVASACCACLAERTQFGKFGDGSANAASADIHSRKAMVRPTILILAAFLSTSWPSPAVEAPLALPLG